MIRKFNYTKRKDLSGDKVVIREKLDSGIKSFEAIFNLQNLGFPDHARIYIEPYFKSSFMRFDFGTVARITPPANTNLNDIPASNRVMFRVKVVDTSGKQGLILGYIDKLLPSSSNDKGDKIPLLPVDFNDLGSKIWKLDYGDNGPYLSVNKNIDQIREHIRNSSFISLVYPEIVRQIAFKIVNDEDDEIDIEDMSSWVGKWFSYFNLTLGIYRPTELTDKEEWAEDVMEAFCRTHTVINLLNK